MYSSDEAICGILFNENRSKVLLIKRRDIPVWVLPGGGVESGETPEQAVCREILEETGYVVEPVKKIAEYLPVNRLTKLTHFYELRLIEGKPLLSKETKDIRFFSLKKLPKYLPPPYPLWIADAIANYPYLLRKKITNVSYPLLFKFLLLHPILTTRFLLTKIGLHINR